MLQCRLVARRRSEPVASPQSTEGNEENEVFVAFVSFCRKPAVFEKNMLDYHRFRPRSQTRRTMAKLLMNRISPMSTAALPYFMTSGIWEI